MAFICAQVDANGIVRSIARLKHEIKGNNVIPLEQYDSSLIGKQYDPETGEFNEVEEEPREKTDDEQRLEELEGKSLSDMTEEEKTEELLLRSRLKR